MTAPVRSLRAAIIAVGSEMLTASRLDTNSLSVTEVLEELGIEVAFKAVVGDKPSDLDAALGHALARHALVVLTGGLGPTDDDVTRDVVAAHLHLPLEEDASVLARIERRFASRGWKMPAVNRRQAMVPRGAAVLPNPNGTAPGLWIEHGDRRLALLPGPPREMKPMMQGAVRERLASLAGQVRLMRRALIIAGRTESRVDELCAPTYTKWLGQDPPIETTILATGRLIELHLRTRAVNAAAGLRALDDAAAQIHAILGPDIVSRDGRSLEQVVGDALRSRGWRLALAESCTGGLATSMLTDVAGSSEYVERAVVAYSNAAKVALLGVPGTLIHEHGAVSEPVARAMAEGIRERAAVDVGVGVTGIAGPGGGSEEKPVGTVCVAVAADATVVRTFRFPGDRQMVKTFAAVTALDLVRRLLRGGPPDTDWVARS
jgi:nicotinamide-nucleotide amidase